MTDRERRLVGMKARSPMDEQQRDVLGRIAYVARLAWRREQGDLDRADLIEWDDLPESEREACRRVGDLIAQTVPPLRAALQIVAFASDNAQLLAEQVPRRQRELAHLFAAYYESGI